MPQVDNYHPGLIQGYYSCYYADTEKQRCCCSFIAQEEEMYLFCLK